jgi:hypothetical protein
MWNEETMEQRMTFRSDIAKLEDWRKEERKALQHLRRVGHPDVAVVPSNQPLVCLRDVRRWRSLIAWYKYVGKCQAEAEYGDRLSLLIGKLDMKGKEPVDFFNECFDENNDREAMCECMVAVIREFGGEDGLTENAIYEHVLALITQGILEEMVNCGEVEREKDRYGRCKYQRICP